MLKGGWLCQVLEADLKTPLPRTFTFQASDKVEELIRRGGGMKDLAAKQAIEQAINKGRGGVVRFIRGTVCKAERLTSQARWSSITSIAVRSASGP